MARIDLARVRSFYEAKMAESKEKGESVWVEIDGEKRWVNSERIDLDLYLKWYKETQHRRTEDLGIAAGKGRVLKVWRMLREGVAPNFQFRELWNATALHIAVSKAMEAKWMPLHLFAIEMLLGHILDRLTGNGHGETAAQAAWDTLTAPFPKFEDDGGSNE